MQLADLDGDGKLRLYVGYWDVVGVQAASLEGKRLGSNRLLNNVRMAVGPAEQGRRSLLCTNSNGPLRCCRFAASRAGAIVVRRRVVQSIAAADLGGDGRLQWCGMTGRKLGENVAVGFNLQRRRVMELHAARGTPAAADRADHRRARFPPRAPGNGSCPAPTGRSTFSPRTASWWTS